jgi:hypothetical protein
VERSTSSLLTWIAISTRSRVERLLSLLPLAADGLAMVDQSLSDRAFIGATLIAAGMGFAFLRFAKIDDHLARLYAYLALFVVGYALFRTAHSRKWLHHHLSYRGGAPGRHRG